jgi:radical SAM protein with 4Fe4S-binding SPASM domain
VTLADGVEAAAVQPFASAPFIVIWEVTRACALACVHCRAEAIPLRHPHELTTEEGKRLIDRVAGFRPRPPLFVLTGGDPMRRRDIAELVRHGVGRGLSVGLTPSGTAAVTRTRLEEVRDAGLARLAVSLDGSDARSHDAYRGVRGSHRYTMRIVDDARELGLPLQVNTTVSCETVADLPAIAEVVERTGAVLWALFFLIPIGRAQPKQALSAAEIEAVLEWAAELQERVSFGIKTTEAPHYHRVLAGRSPAGRAAGRAGRAVTDGNGFLFIDHLGTICPSGFLPLTAGNVRTDDLVEVYREHPLFRSLRDTERLRGRCGRCEFRARCGGSRARAFAATGDPLAEDPGCAYEPGLVAAAGEQRTAAARR